MVEPIDPITYYSPQDQNLWALAKQAEATWIFAEKAYWWSRSSPNAAYMPNPYVTEEFPDPPGMPLPRRDALNAARPVLRAQIRDIRADQHSAAWRAWNAHISSLGRSPFSVRAERGGWYGAGEHRDGSYRIPGRDIFVRRGRERATFEPWNWDADFLDPTGVARYDSQGRPFNGPRRPLFPSGGSGGGGGPV